MKNMTGSLHGEYRCYVTWHGGSLKMCMGSKAVHTDSLARLPAEPFQPQGCRAPVREGRYLPSVVHNESYALE